MWFLRVTCRRGRGGCPPRYMILFNTWVFPKILVPQNHPFVHRVLHYFHHPFGGSNPPIFASLMDPVVAPKKIQPACPSCCFPDSRWIHSTLRSQQSPIGKNIATQLVSRGNSPPKCLFRNPEFSQKISKNSGLGIVVICPDMIHVWYICLDLVYFMLIQVNIPVSFMY